MDQTHDKRPIRPISEKQHAVMNRLVAKFQEATMRDSEVTE